MTALIVTILAPLAAAVLILVSRRGAAPWALAGAVLSTGAAVRLLLAASEGASTAMLLPGLPGMPLRLAAQPLTALLATVVATVATLVLVFALGYMRSDRAQARFFALMSLFVAAMQTLVLAGDWILLLAAWELIGLCSYLLIGFWFDREGVAAAATRAFVYTRSADLGLYAAIFLLIASTGTSAIAPTLSNGGSVATAAGFLLLLAAMGKSAQTPLHDWLQRAMVGPTPVSALLHSATLVAAGAILMIRTAPLLPPAARMAVGVVGGVTAVLAGIMAVGERDLKRLLAASTSSQYGLMLVAVGAGAPIAALVHLVAHAAMKSALFLGAGVFQHAREGTAFDRLAGVGRERPRVFLGFMVAGLAMAGLPPLSGFFTKDAIIAASLTGPGAAVLAPLALAGTLLSGAYVARAMRLLWRGETRAGALPGIGWMGVGLGGLVVLAAGIGLAVEPIGRLLDAAVPGGLSATIAGLTAALGGLALGWWVPAARLLGPLEAWSGRGFAVAGGFDALVARPLLAVSRGCDRLEAVLYAGVVGLGGRTLTLARLVRLCDEQGIDGIIRALVRGARGLGRRALAVQSGLVHRELMLAAAGTGAGIALLLLAAAFTRGNL